jgi:hypothetical protein
MIRSRSKNFIFQTENTDQSRLLNPGRMQKDSVLLDSQDFQYKKLKDDPLPDKEIQIQTVKD